MPTARRDPPPAAVRPGSSPGTVATHSPQRLDSRLLFSGRNVVLIRHAEQDYVLRVTRNGKLILTK